MRKINAKSSTSRNSMIETRPELFNFSLNQGRNVSLILKNDNVKSGVLLGIVEGGTIMMDVLCPQGIGFSETELKDVSEIIVID